MKHRILLTALLFAALLPTTAQVATPTHRIEQTFTIPTPNHKVSPYTGLDRKGWIDAAQWLLDGAFTYIRTMDDPMSHFSFSFRSISKHRGAEMSSRLTPPKEPEIM